MIGKNRIRRGKSAFLSKFTGGRRQAQSRQCFTRGGAKAMVRLLFPAGPSGTTGLHKLVLTAAWCCLLFLAFATLAPLHLRPQMTAAETWLSVLIEHVGAFGVLGLLF